MALQQWHDNGQLYAVIDAAAAPSLVAHFYELGGSDAFPLFAGTDFAAQAERGPWLLPHPPLAFVEAHPTLSGFYCQSAVSKQTMQRHWQSLNNAIHDGESLWFRYADHRILLPMLTAMTPGERDALLGPCQQLMIEGLFVTQSEEFVWAPATDSPWFHIHDHHLVDLYNEVSHASILHSHFWQRMEAVMIAHPDPQPVILRTLQQANKEGLLADVREGVTAGAVALQAGFTLDSIRAPMLLTDDELFQVINWLDKHPDLTGVL
jgi:hypothetical protein